DIVLDRAGQSTERTRERARDLAKRAQRLGESKADLTAEAEPLLRAIDSAYHELQSAEPWLQASEAVVRGVQRVAESVAESRADAPPPSPPRAVTPEQLAEFSADLADAITRLDVVRQALIGLRDNRTLAREFAERTTARLATLDERLANLSARIGTSQLRVAVSRAACADLGRRVTRWIALATIALTLLLLWFAASQVVMLTHGRRLVRGRPAEPAQVGDSRGVGIVGPEPHERLVE
ncbi:MAG TPA: hypothetical protein VK986_12690, partial [Tepidisphaeraceae bacterium]|nr:hypothetical protein [Tepidisphaeraceae bacterium]